MKTTKDISNDLPPLAKGKYCISTGDKLIHHLTYMQLNSLYKHILLFQETERRSFPGTSGHNEHEILIQKVITLEEKQKQPHDSYSIYSKSCEVQMVSYSTIKKIAEILQLFLKEHADGFTSEENTDDINYIPISVWKDHFPEIRQRVFYTVSSISKCITFDYKEQSLRTRYLLSVNELCSSWLSSQQLLILQQKLHEFLKHKKN